MKIDQYMPSSPILRGIIDSYFIIESHDYLEVQTIPNGRIDAVIVLKGQVEWFFADEGCFKPFPACSFYPPTRGIGKARSQNHFKCISIKFYPHVLSLSAFRNKTLKTLCSFDDIFQTPEQDQLLIKNLQEADVSSTVTWLDTYFTEQFFPSREGHHMISNIISSLETGRDETIRMHEVAQQLGISIKTLERRFTKAIGITPKVFSSIRKLQQTVQSIQKLNSSPQHGDLSHLLGGSYYDQAHFIKSCRQITGMTPKKLFTSLAPHMSDLIVVK